MIKLMIDSDKRLWILDKDGAAQSVLDDYLLMFGENDFEELELRCPVNVHGNIISHMNVELVAVSDEEYSYPVHFENQDGTLVSDTILIDRNMTSIAGELPVYVRFSMGEYLGKTNSVVFRIRSNVCEECGTPHTLSVTPQPYPQEFSSFAGYGRVEVGAVDSEELTVTPIDAKQIFTPTLGKYYQKVTVNRPEVLLQDVDVIPSSQAQVITADEEHYALRSVRVEPISSALDLEVKRVAPSVSAQTITPDGEYVGLSEVRVDPVTAQIDSNIVPQNIRKDVTVLGVTGSMDNIEITEAQEEELPMAYFYDYDGTIVGSYTLEEIEQLQAPPSPPAHAGLRFLRYNRSLSGVVSYLRDQNQSSCAGAMYETSDGHTRLYIEVQQTPADTTAVTLSLSLSDALLSLDWGDGTVEEVSASSSSISHTYASAGRYVIDIEKIRGSYTLGRTISNSGNPLLASNREILKAVEMGTDCSLTKNAFQGCTALSRIVLSENVGTIEENAFYECAKLPFVSFPDTVSTIGRNAFVRCNSFKAAVIPDSVVSNIATFENCYGLKRAFFPETSIWVLNNCFNNCYSLEEVSVPDTVQSIGSSAFYNCYNLRRAPLREGLVTVSDSAFYNCQNMKVRSFPSTLTAIGSSAFRGCILPKKLTFPAALTSVGNNAFSACKGGEEIEAGNITFGTDVFSGCLNLKKATFTGALTTGLFANCPNLSQICFADDYTELPCSIFNYCYALGEYKAPATLTSVGYNAFYYANALTVIDFTALSSPPSVVGSSSMASPPSYARILVSSEAVRQLFLSSAGWTQYRSRIDVA